MNSNIILHRLVSEKFGVDESSITNNGDSFVITCADDKVFTEKDFTKSEIEKMKKTIESEIKQELEDTMAAKALLLAKLGITEEEAKLLLS